MGCDIHTIAEVKTPDGWEAALLDKPPFDWRFYAIYAFLADVRNYAEVPAQWPRRDWPDDVTQEARDLRERWDADAHNFTHVSLAELLAFNYDATFENRRVGRQITPNYYNGACTAEPGEGVQTTYRAFLGEAFFAELERLRALGEPTDVRVLMFFDN